ncbi:MAG: PaaI family thioesterase [Candidatus Melainabacteria bacterium]|nr:PaaI family thioesterase [Candidatus Melainabacteria bacterium]
MAKNTFDRDLGVELLSSKKGYCKFKLSVKPKHLNYGGIVHGGVLATLCDIALAGAVTNVLKEGEWCVTAQLNVQYLYPVFPGETVFAYGKLIKKGSTLAFVEGGIETKSKKQIARAQGIWVIKNFPSKKIKRAKTLD